MSPLFSGLRFRLILLVFLALLPALGLMLYSGWEQRQWAALEAREDALRLVRHASLDQERLIQGAAQLLTAIGQLPAVPRQNQAEVSAFLRRLLEQNPSYLNLMILGPKGDISAAALPSPHPVNYADRPWFKRALETRQFIIGEYQIGPISHKPELPLAYPVLDEQGRLQVVVYAALDLTWLSSLAAKIDIPPGSTLAIIDRRGTFLVRHPQPEQWIGKTIPEMETIQQILAKGEGTVEALGIDGQMRLYAFTPLKGMPEGMFMRVGLHKERVFAHAHRVLARNLLALGVVVVLALLAAWLFGSLLIMRGINSLVGATRQLAAGDLRVRTGLGRGTGEIEQLGQGFDQMAAALEQREAQRQRAEEELSISNNFLENIFEDSADVIGIVDAQGKFIRWNKAGLELYGYTLEEVRGRSAFELYPDKNELAKMLAQLRRDGFVRNYEIRMQRKDGRVAPFALSIRLLKDENNRGIGSVTVARDLSDIKDAMAASQALTDRLQEEINERRQAESALHETLEKFKGTVYELEQSNREITLLNELGDLIQACLTSDEAYYGIARFAQEFFAGYSGTLFILNPRQNLLLEAVSTWGEVATGEQVFTADKCWALRRGGVHLFKASGAGLACKHLPRPVTADYMCLPLIAQGEILGLLYLQAPPPFPHDAAEVVVEFLTEHDQRLAVTVAKQVSLALANLHLRESLHLQAIADPLTGLYNRRYLEETCEREIYRAKRRRASVGVIMLDLDHFKRINDNFGHDAGDLVLVSLAGLLRQHTRREDIACRYGGEEFLLILPDTDLDTAYRRAEELRELISLMEVRHLGLSLGQITASFGVAAYPEHGGEADEVIKVADTALYRAKQEGRNRVMVGERPESAGGEGAG